MAQNFRLLCDRKSQGQCEQPTCKDVGKLRAWSRIITRRSPTRLASCIRRVLSSMPVIWGRSSRSLHLCLVYGLDRACDLRARARAIILTRTYNARKVNTAAHILDLQVLLAHETDLIRKAIITSYHHITLRGGMHLLAHTHAIKFVCREMPKVSYAAIRTTSTHPRAPTLKIHHLATRA